MAKLEIIYLQTCAIFYGDVNLPKVFFPGHPVAVGHTHPITSRIWRRSPGK